MGLLIAASSGGNIICSHDGIHGELTYHPVQSISNDCISGMVSRFSEGVSVDSKTLAVDLIEEIRSGPDHMQENSGNRCNLCQRQPTD